MIEEASQTGALFDPLADSFRSDPYPEYHRLREAAPICWSETGCCWLLTRYEDIRFVLSDPCFIIGLDLLEAAYPTLKEVADEPSQRIIRTQILSADPPAHGRIRRILAPQFLMTRLEQLRPVIERIVDERIDEMRVKGRFDLIADFAYSVPFTVICEMMGIPLEERAPLSAWTHDLMRTTDPRPMSRRELEQSNDAARGFRDYFLSLAARVRPDTEGTPLERLVAARDDGAISEEEMVANLILLFCAGHDTVVGLFGNGLLALFRHPDQLELLRRDPSITKNAVEELLRFDASVQIARRTTAEWVRIEETWIAPASYLLCYLGAGNRDPEVFPDPDRLDLRRPDIRPLSFGGGIHYCLGAQLARLEGEIGFRRLLDRLPDLRLETLEPEWNPNVFVRSLKSLWAAG